MGNNWAEQFTKGINLPCLVCERKNKEHKVYWNPLENMYIRQALDYNFVPSSDHYAIVDNLQYLEYKYEKNGQA